MIKHNVEFISNGQIIGRGWVFNECPPIITPYNDVIRCEHCQTPLMFKYHEKACPKNKKSKKNK